MREKVLAALKAAKRALHSATATPILGRYQDDPTNGYRCSVCHGRNVKLVEWADPNRGILAADDWGDARYHYFTLAATDSGSWCDDCSDHTILEVFDTGRKQWNSEVG